MIIVGPTLWLNVKFAVTMIIADDENTKPKFPSYNSDNIPRQEIS